MLQINMFWSFGIGACFACAAGTNLTGTRNVFATSYFAYTVLVLACVFSPCSLYILIGYPGWHSMFLINGEMVSGVPMLASMFVCTNTLQGVLGFYWTSQVIKKQGIIKAQKMYILPYSLVFAILGFGYDRLLYPSNYEDYHNGRRFSLLDFFHSDIFVTLFFMMSLLFPLLYYPHYAWNGYGQGLEMEAGILFAILQWTTLSTTIIFVSFVTFVHTVMSEETLKTWEDPRIEWAGFYAPCIAYVCLSSILFLPVIFPVITGVAFSAMDMHTPHVIPHSPVPPTLTRNFPTHQQSPSPRTSGSGTGGSRRRRKRDQRKSR